MTAEGEERARRGDAEWKSWGPYVSERAWGTVREDYSADGDAWSYFPHEQARSRAYRWSEDGLRDLRRPPAAVPRVRVLERPRPVPQRAHLRSDRSAGNHGEDAKEYWWYLDSTPGLRNYWGYQSIGYFAPHNEYATMERGEQVAEFKQMVRALHAAGLEVILDVVFNHTAEGDENGPTLCFRRT